MVAPEASCCCSVTSRLVQAIAVRLQLAQVRPDTLNAVHVHSSVMAQLVRARAGDLAVVEEHALVQAWQLIAAAVLRRLLAACGTRVAVHEAGHDAEAEVTAAKVQKSDPAKAQQSQYNVQRPKKSHYNH